LSKREQNTLSAATVQVFSIMQGVHLERWQVLSREAAREQNPHRFLELIREIRGMLAEKERPLQPARKKDHNST